MVCSACTRSSRRANPARSGCSGSRRRPWCGSRGRPSVADAKPKALLAWSSGKDSAWALHVLRQEGAVEVVGLLTTLNATHDRVAMHAVRAELLRAQAEAAGLPLRCVHLPWPCPNETYERLMAEALAEARAGGV